MSSDSLGDQLSSTLQGGRPLLNFKLENFCKFSNQRIVGDIDKFNIISKSFSQLFWSWSLLQKALYASHSPVLNPTWNNPLKGSQIGGDIQGQAMIS